MSWLPMSYDHIRSIHFPHDYSDGPLTRPVRHACRLLCRPSPPPGAAFPTSGSGSCCRLAGPGAGGGAGPGGRWGAWSWRGWGAGVWRRMLLARRTAQSCDGGTNSGGTPRPTSSPTSSRDTRRPCRGPLASPVPPRVHVAMRVTDSIAIRVTIRVTTRIVIQVVVIPVAEPLICVSAAWLCSLAVSNRPGSVFHLIRVGIIIHEVCIMFSSSEIPSQDHVVLIRVGIYLSWPEPVSSSESVSAL